MNLREGEAEVAYTGGYADGVGGFGDWQTRKKLYYALALCSARIKPPSIATYAHEVMIWSRCRGLVVAVEVHAAAGEVALGCACARDDDLWFSSCSPIERGSIRSCKSSVQFYRLTDSLFPARTADPVDPMTDTRGVGCRSLHKSARNLICIKVE